jgi:hypothetical protein
VLAWISSLLSLPLVVLTAYVATLRKYGFVSLTTSAYFNGACLGPYVVSAIGVFAYYGIRRKNPHYSSRLLGITCGASFLALLSLSNALQASRAGLDRPDARHIVDLARNPSAPASPSIPASKWDPPTRSLFTDMRSFNEQYLSEVSKLESAALPEYTPESFRDVATIHQILSQLRARLAIAEKFASLEPVLKKVPAYVQSVDASEEDKKRFLEGFESSIRKGLGARKVVTDIEHDWLTASIGLYEFTLSKQGAYTLRDGNLIFKSNGSASEFNRKLMNAQRLRAEFYQAYHASQNQQAAALAQFGLKPADLGLSPRPQFP